MAMQALLRRAPRLAMRAPRATKPRPLATFDESGQQQPTKNANETFVRTPYIADGYFNDEMGELFEYTVQVGDSEEATASSNVLLQVTDENLPPVVQADDNATVAIGKTTALRGMDSFDPNGDGH